MLATVPETLLHWDIRILWVGRSGAHNQTTDMSKFLSEPRNVNRNAYLIELNQHKRPRNVLWNHDLLDLWLNGSWTYGTCTCCSVSHVSAWTYSELSRNSDKVSLIHCTL